MSLPAKRARLEGFIGGILVGFLALGIVVVLLIHSIFGPVDSVPAQGVVPDSTGNWLQDEVIF